MFCFYSGFFLGYSSQFKKCLKCHEMPYLLLINKNVSEQ